MRYALSALEGVPGAPLGVRDQPAALLLAVAGLLAGLLGASARLVPALLPALLGLLPELPPLVLELVLDARAALLVGWSGEGTDQPARAGTPRLSINRRRRRPS
ncbi:hypothetical protein [Streptomyces sp. NPDC045369]|uniref:hypothetical protein n=1 Tax=Streptomyces sp. NPDC045369 TaxID=3155732 RepID=UPI00340D3058